MPAVFGPVTSAARGDGPLDLAAPPPLRPCEPFPFGLARGDARQLPHHRPRELPRREGIIDRRQPRERASHPQPLFGLPATQADDPLHILANAGVAGARVNAEARGRQEPATELALVTGTLGAELDDACVYPLPIPDRLRRRRHFPSSTIPRPRLLARYQQWREPNDLRLRNGHAMARSARLCALATKIRQANSRPRSEMIG